MHRCSALRIYSRCNTELLARPYPKDTRLTWAEKIALALAKKAADGDVRAAAEIADRVEGKPSQQVKVSAHGVGDYHISVGGEMRRLSGLSDEELVEHFNECTKVINRSRPKPLPMVPYKAEAPQ